jgi:hypothetical protein
MTGTVMTESLAPGLCWNCHQAPAATADGLCSGCAGRFARAYAWRRFAEAIHPDNEPDAKRH